jgi:hypothetical protein
MILIPSTKAEGPRFRATLRLDQIVFHLAGTYSTAREAQDVAEGMVAIIQRDIRAKLKHQSLFANPTRAGVRAL